MIRLTDVVKRYPGGREALRGISLEVSKGDFVLLTGHSGAGKSTLLKLVAAIERPTSGLVEVSGQNLARLSVAAIPYLRRNLGLVFQDHKLLYDRSVFENVALPLRIAGFEGADIGRRVRAALERVGLRDRERENPVALSGGEQQRVCIARAVVHRPALILADEPTANLDEAYAREIVSLFQALHQVGVTLMVSTHSAEAFAGVNHCTVDLREGAVAA
ncbi:MAG: cell division ATP-binding protein FtsE [Betaproteobacteria bacterium]|nr:cell division ATP-binding protein FtsE [Betaproteobacteria bacterium]